MTTVHAQLLNLLVTAQRMREEEVHSLANEYNERAYTLLSDLADPAQFDVMHVALCEGSIRVDVRVHTLVAGRMKTSRHNVRIKGEDPVRLAVSGSDDEQQKPYLLEVFSEMITQQCVEAV